MPKFEGFKPVGIVSKQTKFLLFFFHVSAFRLESNGFVAKSAGNCEGQFL